MRYFHLFRVFFRTSVQTDMEYRADFFTRILASVLNLIATVGALHITYSYAPQIKGWSFPMVLVLVAVYYLLDGLIQTFIAPNMRQIMTQVRDGTLDFVLLKPISPQFMATFRRVNIWNAANVLVGIGMVLYTVTRLSLHIGFAEALAFAITLVAGLCIIYSLWLVLVTLTFWFVRIDNIEQLVWQAFEAGRLPIDIYPFWLRMALTYVIPITFIITIPAKALSGQVSLPMCGVSFIIAVCSIVLSSAFWRYGLKNYTGASA